jgi:hypothetical protein
MKCMPFAEERFSVMHKIYFIFYVDPNKKIVKLSV